MGRLQDAFAKLNQKVDAAAIQKAIIGILDPVTGVAVIDAPGRPDGYVLIQLLTGADAGTVVAARNLGSSGAFGTHVRVRPDPQLPNEYIIIDVDPFFALANPTAVPASVPPHRHYIGSGLDDPVELRRWVAGRVWSNGGITITIDPFTFTWNNQQYEYAGVEDYSVAAYTPGSGLQRYIKVGIDPDANTILIASGSTQSTGTPLIFANAQAIAFTGRVLAAVRLYSGQTTIPESDIVDLRDGSGSGAEGMYQQDHIDRTLTIPANYQANYREEIIIGAGGNLIVLGRLYIG